MIIHQILTSDNLEYEFYLSIMSALRVHNPEQLMLWVLDEPNESDGYFKHIKDKVTVRKIAFDFIEGCNSFYEWASLPAFEGKDDNFIKVHLKDVIALKVLYEEGGLFMDLDTLSIQDCTPYFDACENVYLFKHGVDLNYPHTLSFNVAIMMGKPQAPFMWELYNKAKEIIQQNEPISWGATGPTLLNTTASQYLPDETMLSYLDEFCVVDGNGCGRVRGWLSDDGFIWDACRILHIYRSCDYTKSVLSQTPLDEMFIYKSISPYARLVKRILRIQEWNPDYVTQPPQGVSSIKTFHIPCLPHLPANKQESLSCAFTQKTIKMASMMKSLGHKVIAYGIEGSEVECDEFIQVASRYDLVQSFGERQDVTKFYNLKHGHIYDVFSDNAIREINKRKTDIDFLLCSYGWGHKDIADAVGLRLTIESGIGYNDTFAEFKVFESSAWMHTIYGRAGQENGKNYDCIIPNFFDVDDFEYSEEKEDYILFLGRLIHRKGIEIAIQAAERAGVRLLVAGQHCGDNINLNRPNVEYVGYADIETRKRLLSRAKALIVPTVYIGPFEGVHVEAGLSGTPVITSAHGVFSEAVLHGTTGYRCRTMDQYVTAIKNIDAIRPIDCRTYAVGNYSMEKIKWMYDEYFDTLLDLVTGKGYYAEHPDKRSYDAWARVFPNLQ